MYIKGSESVACLLVDAETACWGSEVSSLEHFPFRTTPGSFQTVRYGREVDRKWRSRGFSICLLPRCAAVLWCPNGAH
eukprot:2346412-Rhodomonas_salina.1